MGILYTNYKFYGPKYEFCGGLFMNYCGHFNKSLWDRGMNQIKNTKHLGLKSTPIQTRHSNTLSTLKVWLTDNLEQPKCFSKAETYFPQMI